MDEISSAVTITRDVDAPSQAVWDVLADGWAYATWVVGASRVRRVDHDWPAPDAQLHHSVGIWPAVLNDTTQVVDSDEPHELVLTARAWPAGEARVAISIKPRGDSGCTVQIREDASSGPATFVPKPLRQMGIGARNVEALRRLAYLAEGRHHDTEDGTGSPGSA